MWILNGNGNELINTDHVRRIFVNAQADFVLLGADFGAEKIGRIARYNRADTAREELDDIAQAIMDGRDMYIAHDDHIDAQTPRKIMDSRVRRKGGS